MRHIDGCDNSGPYDDCFCGYYWRGRREAADAVSVHLTGKPEEWLTDGLVQVVLGEAHDQGDHKKL